MGNTEVNAARVEGGFSQWTVGETYRVGELVRIAREEQPKRRSCADVGAGAGTAQSRSAHAFIHRKQGSVRAGGGYRTVLQQPQVHFAGRYFECLRGRQPPFERRISVAQRTPRIPF
jgi:hypothetical protein